MTILMWCFRGLDLGQADVYRLYLDLKDFAYTFARI